MNSALFMSAELLSKIYLIPLVSGTTERILFLALFGVHRLLTSPHSTAVLKRTDKTELLPCFIVEAPTMMMSSIARPSEIDL